MTSSRRQFLIGAAAFGAAPLLAHSQEKPGKQKKLEVLLAEEQKKFEDAQMKWDEERIFEKELWESERRDDLERLTICNELERVLLTRYLKPMDEWLQQQGYMSIETFRTVADRLVPDEDKEKPIDTVWFLLKITSEDKLNGEDIWIKFSIGNSDRELISVDTNNDEVDESKRQKLVPEEFEKTIWRKRDGLLDVLEHHLVQLLEDPGCKQTMTDGTAHLYRIFGPDQDPDKVTKEQLLA